MGCGCSGGRNRVRNTGNRPVITPRNNVSVSSGVAAGPAPIQLQSLSRLPGRSGSGMNSERRFIERKRRAAIARRKFHK
ncbi:MAG: hypothetical protein ACW99G_01195 [Candidatus Thorarchaeota archaeon]|jgi:hypothetical protein